MQFDKDTLKKLLELDDESFRNIVRQVSAAAGADPSRTEAFAADVNGIKRSLARMTPEQAEKIISSVGKEKSEEIFRNIKGGY